ncbi:MAG: class I SAM-dependent methyltransferase, partial [Chitinophagaceae bacterium]
ALLGDLRNKKVLHLQCHFGQDTLSLARMGALPTGLDFSEKAIEKARELTEELQLDATFICGNVYDTRKLYEGFADIIFTSYGVIGWLPELKSWAQNIADCLKPGGRLVFVEFHPFIWTFDNAFSRIEYSYFNRSPIIETEQGTYADENAPINEPSISWNHALGEVFGALHEVGLSISHFQEYDFSPYPIFEKSKKISEDRWAIEGYEGMIPLVYSLVAEKL